MHPAIQYQLIKPAQKTKQRVNKSIMKKEEGKSKNINKEEQNNSSEENKTPGVSNPGLEKKIDTSESDLTDDDLQALGPEDLSMDGGDDEQLAMREEPVDFAGEDLDVPGAELDDDLEDLGSEDEENNLYSLDDDNNN
jgi:hypothetical protein